MSLTMIVKDEEANLADCLKSVADLVDEMVVVDTGSTNRTREITTSLGAKVFDCPWSDNFAAAPQRGAQARHRRLDLLAGCRRSRKRTNHRDTEAQRRKSREESQKRGRPFRALTGNWDCKLK